MNILWKRMEHYNSLLQLSLRLIKDRLLLLNRSCNYISANRQQSPSIRGGRQGALLFKWSHKVPNESSSASSWGIKNRREQLTSSYSRFLRNRKMPDRLLGKRAAWSGVPGHMWIVYCQHFSDLRVHPHLLGGLYGQIAGPQLNFWFGRCVVAGRRFCIPNFPDHVGVSGSGPIHWELLGCGRETGVMWGWFQKQNFKMNSPCAS